MADSAQLRLYERMVDGLRERPAYLLVFGVSALFVLSGVGTTIAGVVMTDIRFVVAGVGSFFIAIGASLAAIWILERRPDKNSDRPHSTHADQAIVNERLHEEVEKIQRNVQQAVELAVPILTEEVAHELNEFVLQSQAWSRGELNSDVTRYRTVLLQLYGRAQRSIFSTTIREYVVGWQEDLMELMIRESEQASAGSVTRVFVFDNHEDLDEHAVEILRRFEHSRRINTLVYFNDEDPSFHFPPDVARDFVVIDDGDAIGVTISYGPGNLRAQWFFGDENRQERFRRICLGLKNGCQPAEQVLAWWDQRREAPAGD